MLKEKACWLKGLAGMLDFGGFLLSVSDRNCHRDSNMDHPAAGIVSMCHVPTCVE